MSIKDNIIKGECDSHLGCMAYLNQKHKQSGVICGFLEEELGCIILCKGNVPQLNMLHESVNNIFGRTLNYLDLSRTTGGSSGGDAGLVQIGAVSLAIGTDIGGSLRIPASVTALTTLKSSDKRTTDKGCFTGRPYQIKPSLNVQLVVGPLLNNVQDLVKFYQSFFHSNIISNYHLNL